VSVRRVIAGVGLAVAMLSLPAVVRAQSGSVATQSAPKLRRPRLILKDGTYQLVLSYKVKGDVVRYRSAERNGEVEEVPLSLVDMAATEAWARGQASGSDDGGQRVVLSPELAQDEAEREALTPEILPGLRLPEEDSVVGLDVFQGIRELVPLQQEGGNLNPETNHNVLKQKVDPRSAAHDVLDLRNDAADVQMHTMQPVFYVRVGNDVGDDSGGSVMTVDTHGASEQATPSGGPANSSYVIERLYVRSDSREVDSFRIGWLGERPQVDVIEMNAEPMAGGDWMKLTPVHPLAEGEYALMEVLSANAVNLGVWDFGVHVGAKEDMEAMRPLPPKPEVLEHREPE
jgi:hypothetical protein